MASGETKKVNINGNVREETRARIEEIAVLTFRGKGDVIDLAIARLWNDLRAGQVDLIPVDCEEDSTDGGETGIVG